MQNVGVRIPRRTEKFRQLADSRPGLRFLVPIEFPNGTHAAARWIIEIDPPPSINIYRLDESVYTTTTNAMPRRLSDIGAEFSHAIYGNTNYGVYCHVNDPESFDLSRDRAEGKEREREGKKNGVHNILASVILSFTASLSPSRSAIEIMINL